MIGLGTILIGVMALASLSLWRGRLYRARSLLWLLMLMLHFPYIATTAGWITAEVGRQPWHIYGIMRTTAGETTHDPSGNDMLTLIGFMGIYAILAILFLFLVSREIEEGPEQLMEARVIEAPVAL